MGVVRSQEDKLPINIIVIYIQTSYPTYPIPQLVKMITTPLSRKMRWILSFTAVILIGLVSGTQYLFSAYGPALADRLNLSSTQTNVIASAGNYGLFLSSPFNGYVRNGDWKLWWLIYINVSLYPLDCYHVKLRGWQLRSSKVWEFIKLLHRYN